MTVVHAAPVVVVVTRESVAPAVPVDPRESVVQLAHKDQWVAQVAQESKVPSDPKDHKVAKAPAAQWDPKVPQDQPVLSDPRVNAVAKVHKAPVVHQDQPVNATASVVPVRAAATIVSLSTTTDRTSVSLAPTTPSPSKTISSSLTPTTTSPSASHTSTPWVTAKSRPSSTVLRTSLRTAKSPSKPPKATASTLETPAASPYQDVVISVWPTPTVSGILSLGKHLKMSRQTTCRSREPYVYQGMDFAPLSNRRQKQRMGNDPSSPEQSDVEPTNKDTLIAQINETVDIESFIPDSDTRPMIRFQGKKGVLLTNGVILFKGEFYGSVSAFGEAITGRTISSLERNGVTFTFGFDSVRWDDPRFQTNRTDRLHAIYTYLTGFD